MKVYIVNGSMEYQKMFLNRGHEVVNSLYEANLIQFTGGEDVSPYLYGDKKHPYTHHSPYRDEIERAVFNICLQQDKPMAGICRGGQFLNVMSGGRMYQHVTNHGGDHPIRDHSSGKEILVSSTHHQMMMPGTGCQVLATASHLSFLEWFDGSEEKKDVSDIGYEVLLYPLTSSLCFQPHPEFPHPRYEEMQNYYFECLKTCLGVE